MIVFYVEFEEVRREDPGGANWYKEPILGKEEAAESGEWLHVMTLSRGRPPWDGEWN